MRSENRHEATQNYNYARHCNRNKLSLCRESADECAMETENEDFANIIHFQSEENEK